MSATTLLVRRNEMVRRDLPGCHGGEGALDFTSILGEPHLSGRSLRFVHDDVLPPGVSIGYHRHDSGEEYYLVLSGHGTMQLDGGEFAVGPGDITAVFAGGSHGLMNTSDSDLRVIVFLVEAS